MLLEIFIPLSSGGDDANPFIDQPLVFTTPSKRNLSGRVKPQPTLVSTCLNQSKCLGIKFVKRFFVVAVVLLDYPPFQQLQSFRVCRMMGLRCKYLSRYLSLCLREEMMLIHILDQPSVFDNAIKTKSILSGSSFNQRSFTTSAATLKKSLLPTGP